MINGLVGSGPPLQRPVQDSKEWESDHQGSEFTDVLNSRGTPEQDKARSPDPERVQRATGSKRSEKTETVPESPPDPKAKVMDPKISAQRQRAIRKFMDSFESEFGIPPQNLVDAMAQLSARDLKQPPEETVEAVIAELPIDPLDQPKAKAMYLGLLTQLNQIDARIDLPKSTDALLSQLSAARLQLSGEKKQFLSEQVQNLGDKFFMKDSSQDHAVQLGSDPRVMELIKKEVSRESVDLKDLPPELIQKLQAVASGQKLSESTEQILNQIRDHLKAQVQLQRLSDAKTDDEAMLDELQVESIAFSPQTMRLERGDLNQGKMDFSQDSSQNPNEQVPLSPEMGELSSTFAADRESVGAQLRGLETKSKAKSGPEKVDLKSLQLGDLSSMLAKVEGDRAGLGVGAAATVAGLQPSQTERAENLQQIMNQAQALMKQGGGEVNVEMKPEGLGAIRMKLQVLDGKVQLQMNTESQEAKKMIESSLHDLKQSLAAHQLSMDHVKVDVVAQASDSSKTQNEMQQQMQKFFDQQQREGTRQFWQQFQENFGNRQARENFYDAQNIRTGVRRQSLPGIREEALPRAQRSGSSGRSLDLVA